MIKYEQSDYAVNLANKLAQALQGSLNDSLFLKAKKSVQDALELYDFSNIKNSDGLSAYGELVNSLQNSLENVEVFYSSILKETYEFEKQYDEIISNVLNRNDTILKTILDIDYFDIQSFSEFLNKSDLQPELLLKNIDFNSVDELYKKGEISDSDITEEFSGFIEKKSISFSKTWDNAKKSKWFLSLRLLLAIMMFFGSPVIDRVKENTLDALGVDDFWKKSGIYEWIDKAFSVDKEKTVSEKDAKNAINHDNIGNISKQKRVDLLNKIQELRTYISAAEQDENTARLLAYLSDLAKDVNGKKYGLVFEEHREEIDEVLDTHTPVLTEDTDLFIDNGGQMNFLIEGDNLASLKLLEKTHKGKIDLIYIDPPYNTLSEGFIYSDNQIDKTDMFHHSKWSSLIYNRLKISKKLLSDKGVIFISIDDNELYSLKFLCDEIFGFENYISTIGVIVKPEGRRYGAFAKTHEYILVYSNNIDNIQLNEIEIEGADYKYYDEIGGFNLKGLRNRNVQAFNSTNRPNLRYPFYVDISNPDKNGLCSVSTEPKEGYIEIWASTVDGLESVWRWGKETASVKIKDLVAYRGKDNEIRIFQKERKLTQTAKTIWEGKEFISQKGTKEIQDILGKGKFDFPKPLELISRILRIGTNTETTVLDFFAGSGTTGHAVMKLNAEDGGKRRFILCTNNENNICRDVTYERIKRVVEKEGYTASLKYYKVDYVPISERMYYEYADELLLHIRELVELENGINFTGNSEIAIVLTDEELADFADNIGDNTICRKLYMGHDILPDEEQQEKLTSHGIEISIIPDYYYRDLQEG